MVFEKLKDMIADQLDVDAETIKMESSITEDLHADSLDVVDLIMAIEGEFDLEIPDNDVENIKTVGDIVNYIEANAAE
ncbi:MAG: acyl carrier protein [Oscillospiraceae bacterium]|nr:acyl carrier protein [Oscillospiraceae bacterium]